MSETLERNRRVPRRSLCVAAAALVLPFSVSGCTSEGVTEKSCTSQTKRFGAINALQGQESAVEVTITPPQDPATFEGYGFGYQYPDGDRTKWDPSDLQLSPDTSQKASFVVKLREEAVSLAVWTQSEKGSEDCGRTPMVEMGFRKPLEEINPDLPVVTWNMSDEIPDFTPTASS